MTVLAHSRLPADFSEWALFVVVGLLCAWILWKTVRYTIHPGEDEPDHVKRSILSSDAGAFGVGTPGVGTTGLSSARARDGKGRP